MKAWERQKFECCVVRFDGSGSYSKVRADRLAVINNHCKEGWQFVSEYVRDSIFTGGIHWTLTLDLTFQRDISELRAMIDEHGRTSYEKA